MSRKQQSGSRTLMTICYSLAAILVMAVLILVVIWFTTKPQKNDSALSNAPDYVVAEKSIWSVEPIPEASTLLNPDKADFVTDVRYAVKPSDGLGTQNIAVSLQLADGSFRTENALLNIKEAVLNWEMGTDFSAAALLGEDYTDAEIKAQDSDFSEAGTYSVEVRLGENTYPFTLLAADTTPPAAELTENLSFSANQQLTAEDFLKSYSDATEVSISFSNEPDTTSTGAKSTVLVLTDAAGNTTKLPVEYMVTGDATPPVLEGCVDLTTIEGCAISYTHNVTATDDVDGDCEVTATESSDFSLKTAGEYTVSYSAKDSSGNEATAEVKVTVLPKDTDLTKIDKEMYMLMGYAITDKLFEDADPDMSEKDRAYACYRYVQDHMYFVDNNLEYEDLDTEWMYPAALAIRQKYGDCRNYYGFARLLYTCCGIENMMVFHPANRAGADRHWWNMIKIDGEWWHADPTPRVGISNFFMKTDAWMDSYSAKNGNCFKRDKSLYPATPTS